MIINPYAFGAAAPTDPNFANVISLAHFDGANLDTSPHDDVVRGAGAWTEGAVNAKLSTTQVKFGTTSLSNGGVGVTNPHSTDWDFGSGDFTVEYWFYLLSQTGTSGSIVYHVTKGNAEGAYSPFLIFTNGSSPSTLGFLCSNDGSSWGISMSGGTVAINTWYYAALCRSGNSFYGFLDGTQVGSTGTMSGALMTNSTDVGIGNKTGGTPNYAISGFIDEFRATKGVARYTSNFTAPTAAFPDS